MFNIWCLNVLMNLIMVQELYHTCEETVYHYLDSYDLNRLPNAILCTLKDSSNENDYLYGILALNTENSLQEGFRRIKNAYERGLFYSSIYFIDYLSDTPFPETSHKAFLLEGITTLKMFYENKKLKNSVQLQLSLILKILNEQNNIQELTNPKKHLVLDVESPKKSLEKWLKNEENSNKENRLNSSMINYHRINAQAGDQVSNFFMGHVYHQGNLGIPADTERAMEHYNNSTDVQGVQNNLAQLLLGSGNESDVDRAIQLLEEGAAAGESYASFNLGLIYMQGKHGKDKDEKKGLKLMKRAAVAGSVDANFYIGTYLKEHPQLDEKKEASSYLEKAAKKGNIGAKISLAQNDLLMGSYNQGLKRVSECLEYIKDTLIFKNRISNSLKKGNYHAALFNAIVLAELKLKSGMKNAVGLSMIIMENTFNKSVDFNKETLNKIIVRYLTKLGKTDTKYLTILGNFHYKRKEYMEAIKCYEGAAKEKDKWGSAILASMFLTGNNVERDWDRAAYYANNLSYSEKDLANILLKFVVNSAVKIKSLWVHGIMNENEI